MPNKTAIQARENRSARVHKAHRLALRPQSDKIAPAGALARMQASRDSVVSATDILTLQSAAGNCAVQRLLGAMLRQTGDPSGIAPPIESSTSGRAIQRKTGPSEEEELQKNRAIPKAQNTTGLPDQLKSGIETLSGYSMNDVKVHYNSAKPAALQALAYAQGSDIHIAPDEEENLPHEAWHVVQQRQGRVRATFQAKGAAINDDQQLEKEADVMGAKAAQIKHQPEDGVRNTEDRNRLFRENPKGVTPFGTGQTIQRVIGTTNETRAPLWRQIPRQQRNTWKAQTMTAFWDLVSTKLQPAFARVGAAQLELTNIDKYMIQADPGGVRTELDALRAGAPVIQGSPVIRNNNSENLLADLKSKMNWIFGRKRTLWDDAITTALTASRAGLTADEEWQIYGEALTALQRNEQRNTRWNAKAQQFAGAITTVSNNANTDLDTWLTDVAARTAVIRRLWTAATANVVGTHGTIPRATVENLFRGYANVTRGILQSGMNLKIYGENWGGVKDLDGHRKYTSELKINAMGGADRVFSKHATPTTFNVIKDDH
jgi:hypothetical protein